MDVDIGPGGAKLWQKTHICERKRSYIDITCVTQNMVSQTEKWEVLEEESLSEHAFILCETRTGKRLVKGLNIEARTAKVNWGLLRAALQIRAPAEEPEEANPREWEKVIKEALEISRSVGPTGVRKVPYWCNEDIERERVDCLRARRTLQRTRSARRGSRLLAEAQEAYRTARLTLRRGIEGYKIATRSLRSIPPYEVPLERVRQVAEALFFTSGLDLEHREPEEDIRLFTLEEMEDAASELKKGKAPGKDGLPTEALLEAVAVAAHWVLGLLNSLLRRQEFPADWKVARLVLALKKVRLPEDPSAYRPICVLSSISKLYEALIRKRLEMEIEAGEGLSPTIRFSQEEVYGTGGGNGNRGQKI